MHDELAEIAYLNVNRREFSASYIRKKLQDITAAAHRLLKQQNNNEYVIKVDDIVWYTGKTQKDQSPNLSKGKRARINKVFKAFEFIKYSLELIDGTIIHRVNPNEFLVIGVQISEKELLEYI